jgi:hypothetical protein
LVKENLMVKERPISCYRRGDVALSPKNCSTLKWIPIECEIRRSGRLSLDEWRIVSVIKVIFRTRFFGWSKKSIRTGRRSDCANLESKIQKPLAHKGIHANAYKPL